MSLITLKSCLLLFLASIVAIKDVDARVLVEAHRGDSRMAPENTLAAINSAIGKADYVEWDVQLTSDGEFILMHDTTVDRTTDGSGPVTNYSLSAIRTLDAGSWFSPSFVGERVPEFFEAILAAQAGGLIPLIERKAGGTPAAYDSKLASMGLEPAGFRLISFDWNFLDGLDALNPNYNLGALGSGSITQSVIDNARGKGADFLDWEHSTLSQEVIDLVHANGMELHAWTVDSPARMQQLISLGVDGITTNEPATLMQLALQAARTADITGDGFVNVADWRQFNAGRGVNLTGSTALQAFHAGDLDGDLDNDIADFVFFKSEFERLNGGGSLTSLQAVPEPNSVELLLLGVVVAKAGAVIFVEV